MNRCSLLLLAALAGFAVAACDTAAADAPSQKNTKGDDDDTDPGKKPGKDGGASGDDDDTTPGPPTTGKINGTVKRYDYTFDLATTKATSKLTVNVGEPGGDCYSVACRSSADDILWGGAPARSSSVANGQLAVCGPATGSNTTAEITTSIAAIPTQTFFGLDVGFSRQSDLSGGQFSYLLNWVGGCDRFGPCDSDPSRLADFHFEVAHPAGTTVLCPGTLTAGDTLTKCDLTGAPTYSGFGLAADPAWKRSAFTSAAGVDVVMYEVPGGGIAANADKASYAEFFTWLTTLLGPFPYGKELRFAGGPTFWLGFEHPANVILNENLDAGSSYGNTVQHVMMHETIHQWSGDHTTIASSSDFVWKEAIAEYLAYVFEDEHRPAGEASSSLAYWDSISLQADHRPRPTDNPPVEQFYTDVYGPGPMVLFVQLEPLLGRPAVLNGIKAFLSAGGARSVDDLRTELGKAGGKDLTAYFNAWVTGPGAPEWPKFDVTTSQAGGQLTVTVTQNNASNVIYGCKVDIDVAGKRATVDFGVAPTNKTATATIPFTGTATPITVDPDHKVINRPGIQGFAPPAKKRVWIL